MSAEERRQQALLTALLFGTFPLSAPAPTQYLTLGAKEQVGNPLWVNVAISAAVIYGFYLRTKGVIEVLWSRPDGLIYGMS